MAGLDHDEAQNGPDRSRNEEHDVHDGNLVRPLYNDRREALTDDNAERIAHAQDCSGHGALAVREPVLGNLGGHTADEGAGHPCSGLTQQGHPVLHLEPGVYIIQDSKVWRGVGAVAAREKWDCGGKYQIGRKEGVKCIISR